MGEEKWEFQRKPYVLGDSQADSEREKINVTANKKSARARAVPYEEARRGIESASRRIALLHLSYAKTLVEELGCEKGKKIIAKAIKHYGIRIGKRTKEEVTAKGLELLPRNFDFGTSYGLPSFGMHDKIEKVNVGKEQRMKYYGCVMAKVWREYGEEKLGRLYCYMDVSKYMGYNPNYKFVHTKTMPDGDSYCEFAVRPTTAKEKKDFASKDKDWFYIDK